MLTLICAHCSRSIPLSEDDVALFYPQFYCLGCGEKIPLPITPEEALKLAHKIDRKRTLNSTDGRKP